jgi:hypothetical protein
VTAYRIAPCGTAEVYVVKLIDEHRASVCSRVGKGWAKRPMTISRADLFATREEARAEYRRRRAATSPESSLNLTTNLEVIAADDACGGDAYCDHEWACTGSAYGGADDRWHGEGRMYCVKCGADGDA